MKKLLLLILLTIFAFQQNVTAEEVYNIIKSETFYSGLTKADGNTNAFTYSLSDSVSDFVSRNNELVSRATGGVKFGLGSVGVMASAGLGSVAVPITGGTSAIIASVTGTGSAYYAFDGYNQAFGNYTSSEGAKVLESSNIPTDSFALEKGKELAIDTGIAITGAAAIKGLGIAGSKVLESSSAQKVKSVLFKSKTEANVATKTTTSKLATTQDSSALYESESSSRIGISAIDGKDKRVHEVLGGYGENISAKDFKLQVQAEKALDAHAKKAASGAGKGSKTSASSSSGLPEEKVSRTGGKESGEVGYTPSDTPVRIKGKWSLSDIKEGLKGKSPKGLGRPDLHHADQMPGSAIHEILPGIHRGNKLLHPNKHNQGVTPLMRKQDRELHWWYRAREEGADEIFPDLIYKKK